jgi:hypothetical protein
MVVVTRVLRRSVLLAAASVTLCTAAPPAVAQPPSPQRHRAEEASMSDNDNRREAAELLALESAVMKAIAAKDRDALRPILADHFVLRMPGAPDVGKEQFLDGIMAVPGDVESIRGEDTKASVLGGLGIVTGLQIATVRLAADGRVVSSRGAFTDVFERIDGRWRLALAFSVELPETAAE